MEFPTPKKIVVGNKQFILVLGSGTLHATVELKNGKESTFTIPGVSHVLGMAFNILSRSDILLCGYLEKADRHRFTVGSSRTGEILFNGYQDSKLYWVDLIIKKPKTFIAAMTVNGDNIKPDDVSCNVLPSKKLKLSMDEAHAWFGHIGEWQLKNLSTSTSDIEIIMGTCLTQCISCIQGKQTQAIIHKGPAS